MSNPRGITEQYPSWVDGWKRLERYLFSEAAVALSGVDFETASTRAGFEGGDPRLRGSLGPDSTRKQVSNKQ